MKKILFAVCGIGLGNATRCSVVIDELDKKFEIRVSAFGNAYDFFKEKTKTYKLFDLFYPKASKFKVIDVIFSNFNIFNFIRNTIKYFLILKDFKPDLVIADSDYACLIPCKFKKIPVVAINNSFTIRKAWNVYRNRVPRGCFFSYYVLEQLDYLSARLFSELIICPTFKHYENKIKKIIQVNPIVRKAGESANRENKNTSYQNNSVLVMFGGSGIKTYNLDFVKIPRPFVIIGTERRYRQGFLSFEGIVRNSLDYLKDARYVIIQGGLSSIFEIIAFNKPCIVIPIRGHAEQNLNALLLEKLGLGLRLNENESLSEKFNQLIDNYEACRLKFANLNIKCNGAAQSARLIEAFLEKNEGYINLH